MGRGRANRDRATLIGARAHCSVSQDVSIRRSGGYVRCRLVLRVQQ
jgi:hypothetical protein